MIFNPLSIAQKIAGGLGLAAIAVLGFLYVNALGDVRHWTKLYTDEHQARSDEQAAVRIARADQKAKDLADARVKESRQAQVTQEVQSSYAQQSADLHRRYDALLLRLRNAPPETTAGGSGGADLPGTAEGPSRADGGACQSGLPPEDALIASEQALRLRSIQDWIRLQGLAP